MDNIFQCGQNQMAAHQTYFVCPRRIYGAEKCVPADLLLFVREDQLELTEHCTLSLPLHRTAHGRVRPHSNADTQRRFKQLQKTSAEFRRPHVIIPLCLHFSGESASAGRHLISMLPVSRCATHTKNKNWHTVQPWLPVLCQLLPWCRSLLFTAGRSSCPGSTPGENTGSPHWAVLGDPTSGANDLLTCTVSCHFICLATVRSLNEQWGNNPHLHVSLQPFSSTVSRLQIWCLNWFYMHRPSGAWATWFVMNWLMYKSNFCCSFLQKTGQVFILGSTLSVQKMLFSTWVLSRCSQRHLSHPRPEPPHGRNSVAGRQKPLTGSCVWMQVVRDHPKVWEHFHNLTLLAGEDDFRSPSAVYHISWYPGTSSCLVKDLEKINIRLQLQQYAGLREWWNSGAKRGENKKIPAAHSP